MNTNIFIIKTLLILWMLCAVLVLCEHQKRDVHRIVIKHRIPRSQKRGNDKHGHTHNHHRHPGKSHNHSHNHKKEKKPNDSSEDDSSSSSSSSESYSRENSFEDVFPKQKGHKSHHHNTRKPQSFPLYHHVNQDYEETKQIPFRDEPKFTFHNEWIPLSSEQMLHSLPEVTRDRYKRKRHSRKSYLTSLKPPPIDLTTSFPFHMETSSNFPQLLSYPSTFFNYDYNQKLIESNQSPLIGTIEHPNLPFSELKDTNGYNQLKNHRTSYEVTENVPEASNTNTLISVPDEDTSENYPEELTTKSSNKYKQEVKSTQRPTRTRGRVTFRGQKSQNS